MRRASWLQRHSSALEPCRVAVGLLLFLSTSFAQYALTLWLPQIVRGFSGLNDLQIGFVSAIPNLAAAIAMVIVAAHSDQTGERGLHIAAVSAVSALGFLGCALVRSPVLAVIFLSLAAGGSSAHGPFWPLPSMFLTGVAAAGGIALINALAALSGFAGPYAVGLLTGASGVRNGLLLLAFVPLDRGSRSARTAGVHQYPFDVLHRAFQLQA